MEPEITTWCGQSSPTLPGWSKTARRTRSTRAHHQMQGPTVASDDEARGFTILESDGFVIESLPPKKRKMESSIHRCNICGRSFSSYQALGGHKAHHNSKHQKAPPPPEHAGILFNNHDDDDAVVVPLGRGGGSGDGDAGTEHRCTFCFKVFSKGQALGGHRRHCQRPMAQNRERLFSFDLNELPPEWFEW